MVMVAVAMVVGPLPMTEAGLQLASAGRPEQVKLTAEKPVDARIPIVVVADAPGLEMVTAAGLDATKNPGVIVKLCDGEALARKLTSPPGAYAAEMLCVPASKLTPLGLAAFPSLFSAKVAPPGIAPKVSVKVTVPVGKPCPEAPLTSART